MNNIADLIPATGFLLIVFLIVSKSDLLKKKGVKVNSFSAGNPGKRKWSYPFFAILLLLFIVEILNPLIGFSLLPKVFSDFLVDSLFIRIVGAFAIFLSLIVLKSALQHFGTSLRFGLNEDNAGKLVTSGVFAHSRNPFFLSLLLFFFGTALAFPNIFFLAFAVLAFAGIHFSILKEEKFMQKVYGEEYTCYFKKVRRYF